MKRTDRSNFKGSISFDKAFDYLVKCAASISGDSDIYRCRQVLGRMEAVAQLFSKKGQCPPCYNFSDVLDHLGIPNEYKTYDEGDMIFWAEDDEGLKKAIERFEKIKTESGFQKAQKTFQIEAQKTFQTEAKE